MKKDLLIIAIAIVLLMAIIHFVVPRLNTAADNHKTSLDTSATAVQIERKYGFAVDSFLIEEHAIESGDNLSVILEKLGFGSQQRHAIATAATDVLDAKKIRLGSPYALVRPKYVSGTDTALFFVYEPSPIEYVVFTIADSISAKKTVRNLIKKDMEASGLITSSLWNAMKASNLDPLLAVKMADVYAWSIDFFGLQKGDKFKLIYEQTTIEGDTAWYKLGKIKAAIFNHMGVDYYAIPYTSAEDSGYYDQKGNSLKTFFLKAPLSFTHISSRFSNSRLHPVLKIYRPHHGVDYSAPTGTPIQSVANGTVMVAQYSGGAGNWVKIQHDQTYTTAYMHLSKFATGIKAGARVSQGQIIGYVGSTGLSTGPHLDFRFWKNGVAIDPLSVIGPPSKPIPANEMNKFEKVKKECNQILARIQYPQSTETEEVGDTIVVPNDIEHDN